MPRLAMGYGARPDFGILEEKGHSVASPQTGKRVSKAFRLMAGVLEGSSYARPAP